MSAVMVDHQYGEREFAAELAALIASGQIAPPEDPKAPGGPTLVDETDYFDPEPRPQMSQIDALEWELWAGVEQDEAERCLLEEAAPDWVFLPPGGDLAAALDQVRPQTESPIALIELMKAAARLTAWSESIRISAMASFYRQRKAQASDFPRPSEMDSRGRPIDPERSWAAEIAAALKISPHTVNGHIDTALRLTSVLSATHTALRCGAISLSKAIAISDVTQPLDDNTARAVEAHVLRRAATQSHANLQRSLRRQVAKYDRKNEADRHRNAKTQRDVRIVPLDDGMAGLWIVHTADKIQQIWVVLQALANLTKRHTPTTSHTTPTDASSTGADTAATADGGANSGTAAAAGATTTADAEAGTAPDAVPGAGVVTGTTTSAPHAGTITDDAGAEADPAANATNGSDRGGAGEAGGGVRDERTAGQRRADMVADLFEFMLWNGLDWLGRRLPDQHRRRPHIEVLTPLSTLLGLDDEPCELTGYGPIPAEMGRRIAADGTWRRILTDPTNGTVLEASTTRHDPGALVSETLLAAHPICDWINCNRAARESDRDHGTPYAQTGATNLADLRSYCELHHIIKDTPRWGWKATNNPDGSTTLTAPTGHRYTTQPATPGPITQPPQPVPAEDEPPPF